MRVSKCEQKPSLNCSNSHKKSLTQKNTYKPEMEGISVETNIVPSPKAGPHQNKASPVGH